MLSQVAEVLQSNCMEANGWREDLALGGCAKEGKEYGLTFEIIYRAIAPRGATQ